MATPYTSQFFNDVQEGSRQSARETMPILAKLLPYRSVVDVGCGTGCWLKVLKDLGVTNVLGLDGDYVARDTLEISPQEFTAIELTCPPQLDRRFDLAMSLEVGEHLPEASAATFVNFLTDLAPVVLFSAAVPGQGGNNHLNEQWPDYWAQKFEARGFVPIDCIRGKVWHNEKVMWWYAQNMILFAKPEIIAANSLLAAAAAATDRDKLSVAHPLAYQNVSKALADANQLIRYLEMKRKPENMPFLGTIGALPTILASAVKRSFQGNRNVSFGSNHKAES
jgi:SAM-dependent methyltransferase